MIEALERAAGEKLQFDPRSAQYDEAGARPAA
jgi:hypothetical protein